MRNLGSNIGFVVRSLVKRITGSLGYEIVRRKPPTAVTWPDDLSEADRMILDRVAPYTMTGLDRQVSLVQAVRHLVRSRVQGCFVECGVWRGGSMMAVALTLLQEGDTSRDLYLFDTFAGMSEPTKDDESFDGTAASVVLKRVEKNTGAWCYAGLDDVRANLASTSYPSSRIHFVEGRVEDTIPRNAPDHPIALLRLDTDWYESTKVELDRLFPRLADDGILIVDDYGHWQGARKAVDEFLGRQAKRYFLHRIDYTGRLLVK
jgi:O-methyltransferase